MAAASIRERQTGTESFVAFSPRVRACGGTSSSSAGRLPRRSARSWETGLQDFNPGAWRAPALRSFQGRAAGNGRTRPLATAAGAGLLQGACRVLLSPGASRAAGTDQLRRVAFSPSGLPLRVCFGARFRSLRFRVGSFVSWRSHHS